MAIAGDRALLDEALVALRRGGEVAGGRSGGGLAPPPSVSRSPPSPRRTRPELSADRVGLLQDLVVGAGDLDVVAVRGSGRPPGAARRCRRACPRRRRPPSRGDLRPSAAPARAAARRSRRRRRRPSPRSASPAPAPDSSTICCDVAGVAARIVGQDVGPRTRGRRVQLAPGDQRAAEPDARQRAGQQPHQRPGPSGGVWMAEHRRGEHRGGEPVLALGQRQRGQAAAHRVADRHPWLRQPRLERGEQRRVVGEEVAVAAGVALQPARAAAAARAPCPRQSCASTVKPRAASSPTTSKYFSIGSVRPPLSTTEPRAGPPAGSSAARSRAPPAPANHSAAAAGRNRRRVRAVERGGLAHARYCILENSACILPCRPMATPMSESRAAGHHRRHRVELAFADRDQVVHAEWSG